MPFVRMNTLEITVPLNKRQFFSDDGYVGSVSAHLQVLLNIYGDQKNYETTKEENGQCFSFRQKTFWGMTREISVHIYYLRSSDECTDTIIRAHEETHALERLGKLKYLFLDMSKNSIVPPIWLLLKKKHYEDLADYGAIYALKKKGLLKNLESKNITLKI